MVARDAAETHRVSTPLELLFDLTFVVAVSRAAAELAHALAGGHLGTAPLGYLMVFFAIWWAWMNFTWFASAYDADDVPYRLLTLVQMAGVLVLASGVPAAFERTDFTTVTIGYVLMRLPMAAQWARAARADAGRRATATRYLIGIGAVQVGWLVRLALPSVPAVIGFGVLVVAELLVPPWAERPASTTWHPHHIAERYGLFTIIVLGECVLAVTAAIAPEAGGRPVTASLIGVSGGGLVLLFALWWMYFLKPAGAGLERRRELAFWWGYGHYGVFAALAALGAALEVAAQAALGPVEASGATIGWAVVIPVAVYLLLLWGLHVPLESAPRRDTAAVATAVVATLALGLAGSLGLPASWVVALSGVPAVALVAFATVRARQPSSSPGR
jgi:low temperature requirement protein LtrA